MKKIVFTIIFGLLICINSIDGFAAKPADINKGMYETCMEHVSSNANLSASLSESKKMCVCFGNKSENYYTKHIKDFEKAQSNSSRQSQESLLKQMNDYAMKECGMSDDSGGNILSKSSLSELKKECPDFITNVLPSELLSQSKCTCNKITAKDREKLIVIENRINEIQDIISEAERTGVISNSDSLLQESIGLQKQAHDVFISIAKKCKAGL